MRSAVREAMNGTAERKGVAATAGNRRSAARLAAVQALYQMQLSGVTAEEAIAQFTAGHAASPVSDEEDGAEALPPLEPGLFGAIVRGVSGGRARFDGMIAGALTTDWTVERLQILVRLILEAGVFELTERTDVPPRVAINEYVNLAHAFFDGAEPGLVNGVLDAVAKSYRGDEMTRTRG